MFGNTARGQAMAEALSRGQFGNQARAQGMQELFAMRNQPLNEFNALRSASPVNMPQFSGPTPIMAGATDVAGNMWNAYNGQMNQWNAQQQQQNNLMGGLFGLGSAAIMASDERVKEDIEPIGELPSGEGLYEYHYTFDPTKTRQVGVMAQEVEQTNPAAVITGADGIKRVDYRKVLARALEAA
jgi:hypothetical protein